MASSATAYATPTQLLIYHDARRLGDLVSDDDTRVSPSALLANDKVAAALSRASGDLELAAQVGGRYTPTDLASLTGVAAEALVGVVCDLAVWHLEKRRARGITMADVPGAQEAHDVLAALRDEQLIFPTDAALSAVTIENVEQTTSGVSDINGGRYGQTVNAFRRFFGRRGGELSNGR